MTLLLEDIMPKTGEHYIKTVIVNSKKEAKIMWVEARDRLGWGASDFQFKEAGFLIGDNGKQIGQFSYNGKLWEQKTLIQF